MVAMLACQTTGLPTLAQPTPAARIDATPRVEQEMTTITRDFGNLKENYLGLVNKKLDVHMAAKLEERWQGDRFRILDPAQVPDRPFYPNPTLFMAVGVVLGLVVGLGAAVLAEFLDHSLKNIADVEAALPYPMLAAVPHLRPLRPSKSRRQRIVVFSISERSPRWSTRSSRT
jgi:capsular polysaccharide biosynthesis protein